MKHEGLFERTSILISDEGIEQLKKSRILLAGVGGVGSFAAEALARAGVGYIKLIDADTVAASNLNRQLVALESTIDQKKVDIMAQRIKDINPLCQVEVIDDFIRKDTMDEIFNEPFDYVLDAIDSLTSKVAYVRTAHEKGYRVISSMGAGGKINPTTIQVKDIYKTSVCKLARLMRIRLKRQGVRKGIKAVFSDELPIAPLPPEPVAGEGRARAVNGTISYMPALFGLTMAGEVIKDLIETYTKKR
ncbi:tRNA threonylcarbamoyladenosine dehydratase [Thiotrichales bacterium 19S3-7]|nr:tRNA threonylcarbamoyladenosine dehydratase [Thiotrichales bacterium 19S3-7]MCF6803012.1 tRNA threonylcarbamoyladenosine dehydratase [Thiotrichales bacterium 19S3-11]